MRRFMGVFWGWGFCEMGELKIFFFKEKLMNVYCSRMEQSAKVFQHIETNRAIAGAVFGAIVFTGMQMIHSFFRSIRSHWQTIVSFRDMKPLYGFFMYNFFITFFYYIILLAWVVAIIEVRIRITREQMDPSDAESKLKWILYPLCLFSFLILLNYGLWMFILSPTFQQKYPHITNIEDCYNDNSPQMLFVISIILCHFRVGYAGEKIYKNSPEEQQPLLP